MSNTLREKTLPSPPPLALVAGRGDGHPLSAHQQFRHHVVESAHAHYDVSKHSSGGGSSPYGAQYPNQNNNNHHLHPIKGSSGPLGPLNLNAPAAWSKINPYVPALPLNYGSASSVSRPAFGMFSPRSAHNHHHQNGSQSGQFSSPSHFTPLTNFREPGSPPHISPPLSHEPAYPVLRIEENNRSRIVSPSYTEQPQHPDIKRESFSHPSAHLHHNSVKMEPTVHSHHSPQEYCESAAYYSTNSNSFHQLSPSHSPIHSDSGNSRDSNLSPHHHHHRDEQKSSPIVPINVNGSVRYQCPDCSKSYSTYSGLSKHMQFHCASQNKKSFVCKFCEKVYVSLGALKMHIRTHTLPCKCTICGKAFSRPWLLQGNISLIILLQCIY